jgi:soluble lytic murein transglycosylase-like protein
MRGVRVRRLRRRVRAHALVASALVAAIVAIGGPQPATRLGLAGSRPAAAAPPRLVALPAASDAEHMEARELDAFARDLAATGRVKPERARALSRLAVRQARAHRIPPALLLGVLLVENEPLDSRAVSSAGARGLMQVHPLWRPVLGSRYCYDLTADSTNLAMGAHILGDLLWRARSVTDVERGLLRYNGCRRALRANAAGPGASARVSCAGYPRKVRRRVEEQAAALCPSRSFARCVVQPIQVAAADARRPE